VRERDIVDRIWPGREAEIEALGGGITNRNFKVSLDGEAYVLRIGGKHTELLGIDRTAEYGASRVAAALGIGPEIAVFVEPEGFLVTRFIDGRSVPPEEMRLPETIARAAHTIRRLHEGPLIPGRFDSFHVVETYARRRASTASVSLTNTPGRKHSPTASNALAVTLRSCPVTTTS